jgi:hypothetical protein
LFGVLILLAAAPSASTPLLDARSPKSLDEFGACFTRGAERSDRAWAYLPSERGGTFTDSGARGEPASYWLLVRGAGSGTRLRLYASAPSSMAPELIEAVDKCR